DLIEDLLTQKLKDLQYTMIKQEKEQMKFYEKPIKENLIIENNEEEYATNLLTHDNNMECAA
ncbi:MAG: hypothetical protein NTY95_16225, partial [Bacteroidia bacterium]|nr:hypothetical protein [Bacteroidia bacterium]